jgi:outer membrane protein, heavy metal efflux system
MSLRRSGPRLLGASPSDSTASFRLRCFLLSWSLTLALLLTSLASVRADDHQRQEAVDAFDEAGLARLLWERSPALLATRQELAEAEAVRDRTHLLPNPGLAASWATIPLGERNPPGHPFWQTPNYTVGLSQFVELGKRGPRQRAAAAALAATRHTLEDGFRLTFFALLESLAEQAEAAGRIAVLEGLAADSAETLRLQRARAERGDVAGLEVDRLEVEHLRLLSELREAEGEREAAVATCGQILGSACPRFRDAQEARRFLARAEEVPPPPVGAVDLALRPDLRALAAREAEAEAELELASRQKIPDPVVSFGYQRDQFVLAGAQANSLILEVAIPLPIFDRGQVDAVRARRVRQAAAATREAFVRASAQSLEIRRQSLELLSARARALDEEAVPRARSVAERMEAAAQRGGAALQDVLLARRALQELQLDRIEVAVARYKALLDIRRGVEVVPRPAGLGQLGQGVR